MPGIFAVIMAVPAVFPAAKPAEEIATIVELELTQVTRVVMTELDPSEKVPVAINC